MLWLTADWHLGENRFEIMQRPFKTVAEHIDTLVERHNSLVKPEDEVIVAGDAVYQKAPEYVEHLSRFNGRKTLIRGNHDRVIDDDTFAKYFDIIVEEGAGIPIEAGGIPCWVTHYPSQGRQDMFNLVGHIHGAWKYQLNMFNIGVDANHFFPVSSEKIKFHFDAVVNYYDGDIWIGYSPINSFYYGKRGNSTFYYTNRPDAA
jgi:calcineurin-like phosphoesterase family protein